MISDDDEEAYAALAETGFWGRAGSGCLPFSRRTGRFLLARRSEHVLEPLTWGTWGGAIPAGITPEDNVFIELLEETMFDGDAELIHAYTFEDAKSGFVYLNYIAVIEDEFDPELNWENCDFGWFEQGEFPEPAHPGLRALLNNIPDLVSLTDREYPRPR